MYRLFLTLFLVFVPAVSFATMHPPVELEPELLEKPAPEGFVLVKGGCFEMGDTFGDSDSPYGSFEKPLHEVCVNDFYLSKYLVTQRQWMEVIKNNPSQFKGCYDCPVEQVSWADAKEFISKLNKNTAKKYRLPTEAEWEYAARSGGKHEKWAGTSNQNELEDYAWFDENSNNQTHPVGQKRPNGLGIYDMSGNVWEWVSDWFGSYYNNSPKDNPQGPSSGSYHVIRGGSYLNNAWSCRASNRTRSRGHSGMALNVRDSDIGFRLALSAQ